MVVVGGGGGGGGGVTARCHSIMLEGSKEHLVTMRTSLINMLLCSQLSDHPAVWKRSETLTMVTR